MMPYILCVDDDDDDRILIMEAISSFDDPFQIIEMKNGLDAVEYLMHNKENHLLPTLIIMDINMPKMDGRQAIHVIKRDQILSSIPIAVFTTSSDQSDKDYFENQGVHFITKPCDYKIFVKKITDLLMYYRHN